MLKLTHRLASPGDVSELIELMRLSIIENMKPFLCPAEVEAAQETMGLDQTLIEDQSYFIIETVEHGNTIMVGCGGWGKRRTLYGGDHTPGRDDSYSDPAVEAARIRAMYTHPSWIRCGVGSYLLDVSEALARDAGFKKIELGATLPGEPFYLARGYKEVARETNVAANGANNVVITMKKAL
ncbi:MAG: GNAT superfamily N-acetyltransferase [Paraglaciecola sp.]